MTDVATKARGTRLPTRSALDILTMVEIVVYRAAVILSFVIYVYKHLKEQLGH